MSTPPPPRDPIAIARRQRAGGDLSGAMRMLQRAASLPTHRLPAMLELADLLNTAGVFNDAEAAYREALKIEPDNINARLGLADVYLTLSKIDAAKSIYVTLASEQPNNADIQLGLGECALHSGDLDTAFSALSVALKKRPGDATIQFNLGQVHHMRGALDEAERLYRAAIDTLRDTPECATVWNSLGGLLVGRDDYLTARLAFEKAVEILPELVPGHNNLGEACKEIGDLQAARSAFQSACRLSEDYVPARYNLAILDLLEGRYAQGWPNYELRWQVPPLCDDPRQLQPPRWQGEALSGKTLLVHAEQGLGDTIQFLRFLPGILSTGLELKLAVQPQLMHLVPGLGNLSVHPLTDVSTIDADFHCPLMSLPLHMGITIESLPQPATIPASDSGRKAMWEKRLPDGGLKIAICWQGNPNAAADRGRSPPLACFKSIADLPGCRLISLQKSHGLDQLETLGEAFSLMEQGKAFDSGPDAFADSIAIIEQVDLVVTGDTAVAHLAASMGKPTWIALKQIPDWRWGVKGETCAWYPSARLFRQYSSGNWQDVFEDMADALASWSPGQV